MAKLVTLLKTSIIPIVLLIGAFAWVYLSFGLGLGAVFSDEPLPVYLQIFVWPSVFYVHLSDAFPESFTLPASAIIIWLILLVPWYIARKRFKLTQVAWAPLIFTLIPIITFSIISLQGYLRYNSPTARQQQQKIKDEQAAIIAQRNQQLNTLKLSLPVMEPKYLPSNIKKEKEDLWDDNTIQLTYTGCLFIYEHRTPLSRDDIYLQSRSPSKQTALAPGITATIYPSISDEYVLFEYKDIVFKSLVNTIGTCPNHPIISETQHLQILRSIIDN